MFNFQLCHIKLDDAYTEHPTLLQNYQQTKIRGFTIARI